MVSTQVRRSVRTLEGKAALHLGRFMVYNFLDLLDTKGWVNQSGKDLYLVTFPLAIYQLSQNSRYEEIRVEVELTTPNAIAVDLFPKHVTTAGEAQKTYNLSLVSYVKEINGDLVQANKDIRFENLQPTIMSFGTLERTFGWVYTGFGSQKEVIPGTKFVLFILQVPHGTTSITGTTRFGAIVAKKLFGLWRRGAVSTDSYSFSLELPGHFSENGASKALTSPAITSHPDESEIILSEISLQTFSIRIVEEPLTAHNLAAIISVLTELSTKCWLIMEGRFAELMEYTQTHDGRFSEKAPVFITKVTYNSPMNIDWKVDLSATNAADALITAINGVTQVKKKLEKAELENQAKAQEIKHTAQNAEQEHQMALLKAEEQRLMLEERRLSILEKRLEIQKKEVEYALEIARKMVDTLYPNAEEEVKPMLLQGLLPNLLQLGTVKGLEINSSISLDASSVQQKPDKDRSI